MDITYHFPPELMTLLIDTLPLLCPRKKDLVLFFRGAGVSRLLLSDIEQVVATNPDSTNKYEMVRTVLARLNERGEAMLRARREVLKRVVEFEDFSSCWPDDQLRAKGLVAEIRRVVNVKDAFTRMADERQREHENHLAARRAAEARKAERLAKLRAVRADLLALFTETNPQRRGKALEGVLNRLFEAAGILTKEAFALVGDSGEGVVEQIDGLVDLDGNHYLVEMRWRNEPLGTGDVSQHLVRIYSRGHARGIIISASGYTEPAVSTCRESLAKIVVVLCTLEEIVRLLEREDDLLSFLRDKITAAVVYKNPLHQPLSS